MWVSLLDKLPPHYFEEFALVQRMFNLIIDGLWAAGFEPKDPHPQPPLPESRIMTMYLAAEKCQQLTNRIPKSWEDSKEQIAVTARAWTFGYSFLPPSMIRPPGNAHSKPTTLELPKPKSPDSLLSSFRSLFQRRALTP